MTHNKFLKTVLGVLNVGGIWLLALLFLFPFFWMISNAIRPSNEIFLYPPSVFPKTWQWENFSIAWNKLPFARYFFNSLLVSVGILAIFATVSIGAAYSFSRLRWKGREVVLIAYLSTLMIPQMMLMIPQFLTINMFGWINTYAGLIVPVAFGSFGVFLLRQFFLQVPNELEESAKIDGASAFRRLVDVVLPLSLPAVGLIALFNFIYTWSGFLWPLIVASDTEHTTLPVGLTLFQDDQGSDWNFIMAGAAFSMIPGVILAIALQKYIYNGISANTGFGGR